MCVYDTEHASHFITMLAHQQSEFYGGLIHKLEFKIVSTKNKRYDNWIATKRSVVPLERKKIGIVNIVRMLFNTFWPNFDSNSTRCLVGLESIEGTHQHIDSLPSKTHMAIFFHDSLKYENHGSENRISIVGAGTGLVE